MSFNRNIPTDRQATKNAIRVGRGAVTNGKNWLGHRAEAGNAKIDELLLSRDGVSLAIMEKYRGAVKEHLRHLSIEHGLTVEEFGGKYRFK